MIKNLQNRKEIIALGLVILLGIGLRLHHLDAQTLWSDEIHIVQDAERDVYSIFKKRPDNSPPLYHLFMHFWIQLFGTSEFSVRLLSTLFGVLLIPSVYIAARHIFNSTESALISALIVAISPYQIYYSQDNRHYTLLPLLSLLSVYFLYRSLSENKRSLWILYIIMTSLCTYTHNYGLFLFPVGYIYLLLTKENNRFALFKRLLFSQLVILLLYIPWVSTLMSQIAEGGATCWIKKPSSIFVIFGSLESFSSFYTTNRNTFNKFLTLASVFFIFKGIFTNPIKNHISFVIDRGVKEYFKIIAKKSVSGSHILLLEYLFSPLIVAYSFSILIQPIYAVGRYDSVSYPAFCLILGSGIASIKNRFGRSIVIAGIIILTCNPLYNYYYNTIKSHDSKGTVSFVKELSLKDRTTMIVCAGFSFTELRYYFEKDNLDIDVQEFYPRNKEGAMAMIHDVINAHERQNEKLQFLTYYDNGNNSKILENEVIKYFQPIKEKWFNRGAARVVYYEELPTDFYVLNESTINFWDKSQRKYLVEGWSSTEEWGTWSEGKESVMLVNFKGLRNEIASPSARNDKWGALHPTPPSPSKGEDIGGGKDYTMLIKATGFSIPGKQQSVRIYLDDNLLGEHIFTHPVTYFEDIEMKIPLAYIKEGNQRIRFVYSFVGSPAEYGMGPDLRQLAMGVSSIGFK